MSTMQIISLVWTLIVAIIYVYFSNRLHKVFKKDSTLFQVVFVATVFVVAGLGIYLTELLIASTSVRSFILPLWYCLPIAYAGYFFDYSRRG